MAIACRRSWGRRRRHRPAQGRPCAATGRPVRCLRRVVRQRQDRCGPQRSPQHIRAQPHPRHPGGERQSGRIRRLGHFFGLRAQTHGLHQRHQPIRLIAPTHPGTRLPEHRPLTAVHHMREPPVPTDRSHHRYGLGALGQDPQNLPARTSKPFSSTVTAHTTGPSRSSNRPVGSVNITDWMRPGSAPIRRSVSSAQALGRKRCKTPPPGPGTARPARRNPPPSPHSQGPLRRERDLFFRVCPMTSHAPEAVPFIPQEQHVLGHARERPSPAPAGPPGGQPAWTPCAISRPRDRRRAEPAARSGHRSRRHATGDGTARTFGVPALPSVSQRPFARPDEQQMIFAWGRGNGRRGNAAGAGTRCTRPRGGDIVAGQRGIT